MVVYNGERECDNDNSVINIYPSINYYSKLMIISIVQTNDIQTVINCDKWVSYFQIDTTTDVRQYE